MSKKDNKEIIFKRFGVDSVTTTTTTKPANESGTKTLKIIHFNDVYNIEGFQKEPVGGASRFLTAINSFNKDKDNLIVFSGDAFSPSTRKSSFNIFYILFSVSIILSEIFFFFLITKKWAYLPRVIRWLKPWTKWTFMRPL